MTPCRTAGNAAAVIALSLCLQACAPRDPPRPADPRVEQFAKLPDWRGYWVAEGMKADISGYTAEGPSAAIHMEFQGQDAPWKPEQLKKIQAMAPAIVAAVAKGKSTGWGYPMMMQSFAPLQFLITPEETLMMNFYRDVRHVYTDGRSHPAPDDLWPTPWGDSIGHWEGDTLVIETIAVQRPGILFVPIPFVSEGARYTERLRRVSADRMESEFTIEDSETLARPWTFRLAYVRQPALDRLIHEAFDNDRVEVDADGELLTITPPRH
jgi:hypothetical protein